MVSPPKSRHFHDQKVALARCVSSPRLVGRVQRSYPSHTHRILDLTEYTGYTLAFVDHTIGSQRLRKQYQVVTHGNFPLSTRVTPFGLSSHPNHDELGT